MVFFSSELCTWDLISCTIKLVHTCMHSYQGKLDCGFAVFLTCAWCDSWYWMIYNIFPHGFKLCLWFLLSWFIIHRSPCCVQDWFGNEPLLNRTPCAHADVARCYEWCLMPAWYVLHPHACFSTDIVQYMGHRFWMQSCYNHQENILSWGGVLSSSQKQVAMETTSKLNISCVKKKKNK